MPKGPCAARVLLILLSQLFSLKDGPAPPPPPRGGRQRWF